MPAKEFAEILSSHLDILFQLSKQINPKTPREWKIVKLSMNSPVEISIVPLQATDMFGSPPEYAAYLDVISSVERGKESRFIDDEILSDIQTIARANGFIQSVSYEFGESAPYAVSDRLKKSAPQFKTLISTKVVVENLSHEASTSMIGKLEKLNAHQKLEITIYDEFTGRAIPCTFRETLWQAVHENIRKRVEAFGIAKYGNDGLIKSFVLKDLNAITVNISDIMEQDGIDIGGEEDSATHVRRLRDGE